MADFNALSDFDTFHRLTARPEKGPRSLTAMVLDVVAQLMSKLSAEHIAELPAKYSSMLRTLLISRGELSFHAWKLLVPCHQDERGPDTKDSGGQGLPWPSQLFCEQHEQTESPLLVYMDHLRAPPLQFIAHLRIVASSANANFGAEELMALAALPNLGVLELLDLSDQVSDRLVKGWSLTQPTALSGPFPALRVLRLWGCRDDALTQACLPYATRFPVLAYFDVCVTVPATAKAKTWKKPSSLSRPPKHGRSAHWADVKSVCRPLGWSGYRVTGWERRYDLTDPGNHAREAHDITGEGEKGSADGVGGGSAGGNDGGIKFRTIAAGNADPATRAHWWAFKLYSFVSERGYSDAMLQGGSAPGVTVDLRDVPLSRRPFATMTLGVDGHSESIVERTETYVFARTAECVRRNEAVGGGEEGQEEETGVLTTAASTTPSSSFSARKRLERSSPSQPRLKRKKKGYKVGDLLGLFNGA